MPSSINCRPSPCWWTRGWWSSCGSAGTTASAVCFPAPATRCQSPRSSPKAQARLTGMCATPKPSWRTATTGRTVPSGSGSSAPSSWPRRWQARRCGTAITWISGAGFTPATVTSPTRDQTTKKLRFHSRRRSGWELTDLSGCSRPRPTTTASVEPAGMPGWSGGGSTCRCCRAWARTRSTGWSYGAGPRTPGSSCRWPGRSPLPWLTTATRAGCRCALTRPPAAAGSSLP